MRWGLLALLVIALFIVGCDYGSTDSVTGGYYDYNSSR